MPIQGAGGETAIQYNGNTYVNANPTRVAYNTNPSWNTVKRPTAPTPRHPAPAPKPKPAPTPTPVYHAPAPPVTQWAPPAYTPPVPMGKYASIYSPTDTSATVGKPQAPTAFDQKWDPTLAPRTPQQAPLGKIQNLEYNAADVNQTNYDRMHPNAPVTSNIYSNHPKNYASNPTGLAQSLTGHSGWGNVIDDIKNLFTPQIVNDKPSAVNNPTLAAQKAVTNNDPWAALTNLGKGIAAPIVGLAGMFGDNNNDQKKAPQDANARDITNKTPTPASQMSPYPNYGHSIDMSSLVGQAPTANNPYGLNPSASQSSSGGSAKTSNQLIDPKNVDPSVAVMTTDKDGNQVKATPYDIAYNPDLYYKYMQMKDPQGQERAIIPHGNGQAVLDAIKSPTSDSAPQNTGGNGSADLNSIGLGDGGFGGSGGNLLDSLMGGGGMGMAGMPGNTGGVPTDGSGQPSFLDYGLNADEQNALMQYAKGQALLQNNVQRNSLDLQKNQQEDAYNSQVGSLNNDLTNAQQQLENQSFQDYLKSRQDIADRGLGSSGLANDADTRLMLNRDQQLGQLQRQNSASLASALATKNTNESNIAAQRSQINDDVTANNLFQQLYSQRLTSKQQANQLAEDWAKWNQTSGNYAYRFGVSAQNAQLNAATKLQVAQMANQMKLQTTDMNNNTKINVAQGNLQAKLQQINNQAWNWSQQQNISLANQLGQGAMNILKQIPNATSPQEAQGLLNQYNSMMDEFANQLGQAQQGASAPSSGFNYSSGGGGAVPALSGSNTAQQIWNFLRSKGLSAGAAAGVMGNLQQESGLNPAIHGGGLAQWIGGRGTALANYAKSIGQSPQSLQAQLGYLWNELSSGSEGLTPQQLNSMSPQQAALAFSNNFERPAKWAANNTGRQNYAMQFYNMLNR